MSVLFSLIFGVFAYLLVGMGLFSMCSDTSECTPLGTFLWLGTYLFFWPLLAAFWLLVVVFCLIAIVVGSCFEVTKEMFTKCDKREPKPEGTQEEKKEEGKKEETAAPQGSQMD